MTVMAYDEMYIWLIKNVFGMHQPTLIMSAHPVRDTPAEELSSGRITPTDPINEKAGSEISHSSTLASRPNAYPTKRGPVTDAVVNFFSLRRKHRDTELLDDIATQPSVYDTEQAEHYQPRDDWENIEAFDPTFRWTWREEAKALKKVDWKVLTWVCVMFFALGEPCSGSLCHANSC
jgi:hypothetical protein